MQRLKRVMRFMAAMTVAAVMSIPVQHISLAQGNTAAPRPSSSCDTNRVETLAAALTVDSTLTADLQQCYLSLSDFEKAQTFEAVAAKKGLLDQLRRERQSSNAGAATRAPVGDRVTTLAPGDWRQLIEHALIAFGEIRTPNGAYLGDSVCAPGRGQEYVFLLDFSGPVSNPDGLRTNSLDPLVDSMLVYYQLWYGGVDGFGNVGIGRVYVCIGNTGISIAGFNNVYYNMRVIKL